VSIHVDVDEIYATVTELQDVQNGEVWGALLQLQLRAEEIEAQRRELELLRQRLVKHTGTAALDQVEELLQVANRSPAEWRKALEHERSRLRAYYTRASQQVAESLLQLIEHQALDNLPLVEQALEVCQGQGYEHPLIRTARTQLEEHREHLVLLRKAATLRVECQREATKRAAAEARYSVTRGETEQLERQLKTLQCKLYMQEQQQQEPQEQQQHQSRGRQKQQQHQPRWQRRRQRHDVRLATTTSVCSTLIGGEAEAETEAAAEAEGRHRGRARGETGPAPGFAGGGGGTSSSRQSLSRWDSLGSDASDVTAIGDVQDD
jgi:hypothetical protein